MAELLHLYLAFIHRFPMNEVEQAEAIFDRGLKGCIHGRPQGIRQVLLMDAETLGLLRIPHGAVKENITTRGLDFSRLAVGQRLQIGHAHFELSAPCHPCARMNEIRDGLEQQLRGRRGWLCRIVHAGTLRRGDTIYMHSSQNPLSRTSPSAS